MPHRNRVSDRVFALLLALAMVGWGGTWTSAKLIADAASLELVVFWRFALTSVALGLVVLAARESLALSWRSLPGLVAAAAAMTAYNHLFFAGVRAGLAGTGGVIVTSLNPVFTFVAMRILQRRLPTAVETLGIALGLAGGAVLLGVWRLRWSELLASGNLFFLLAAATWTVLTVLSQGVQRWVSFLSYSFYVNLLSTLMNLPWAIGGGMLVHAARPFSFWANIGYLAVIGTAFATTVFFRASRRLGAQAAASYVFLVPALAPVIAWLVLGEVPTRATLIGGPLAVLAVYLINRASPAGERAQGSPQRSRAAGSPE